MYVHIVFYVPNTVRKLVVPIIIIIAPFLPVDEHWTLNTVRGLCTSGYRLVLLLSVVNYLVFLSRFSFLLNSDFTCSTFNRGNYFVSFICEFHWNMNFKIKTTKRKLRALNSIQSFRFTGSIKYQHVECLKWKSNSNSKKKNFFFSFPVTKINTFFAFASRFGVFHTSTFT